MDGWQIVKASSWGVQLCRSTRDGVCGMGCVCVRGSGEAVGALGWGWGR